MTTRRPSHDRPAPPHSDTLNRLVGITPEAREIEVCEADIVNPLEEAVRRARRRRAAAERSRRRRGQAA